MEDREFIWGRNVAIETLNSKHDIYEIYLQEGVRFDDIVAMAKKKRVRIINKPRRELDEMVGKKHQGVVLCVEKYSYRTLTELIENLQNKYPLVLILDEIEDPHNLGSIIRTASAAGADGIIISKYNSAELTPTVARVSTGAVANMPVVQMNINVAIDKLKKEGFFIVGSDITAKKNYTEIDYRRPIALVIGSEGRGIRDIVRKECDYLIKIPMANQMDSLNAGVATGVMIFEIIRSRGV